MVLMPWFDALGVFDLVSWDVFEKSGFQLTTTLPNYICLSLFLPRLQRK